MDPQRVLVLVQAFSGLRDMRFGDGGQLTNKTMTRELERSFRQQYNLSEAQYDCIARLYDHGEVGDTNRALLESMPPATQGNQPNFVRKCFAHGKVLCCNRKLQVRGINSTVYERATCYEAKHFVKTCMTCGASYYLNKQVLPVTDDGGVRYLCHLFFPWTSGELPAFISNKSGKGIFSLEFVTDCIITQYRQG